jgi:hypothetical protein
LVITIGTIRDPLEDPGEDGKIILILYILYNNNININEVGCGGMG